MPQESPDRTLNTRIESPFCQAYEMELYLKQHITQHVVIIWVNVFQTEKTNEIQLVRPTEVCGKE